MNLRTFLLLAGWAVWIGTEAQAQSADRLQPYLEQGLRSNLELQQKELDLRKSMEAVRQAKALFYPSVQFKANYTLAAGGRKIDFPIGDLLNPVYGTLNQLTQSNAFPTLENQQIQFLPNNFHETKFTFAYPLYNSDLKYNRQIQELLLLSQQEQKEAFAQQLRFEIALAYLQYQQALAAEKIWIGARSVLNELKRFNESLVKNQVATKDIVSDADYELSKAEHEIYALQSQQNTARAFLNFLTNHPLQDTVAPDSLILQPVLATATLDQCLQTALSGRREFAALDAGKKAALSALALQEANRKLPDFYVGGEAGFQGFGYKFNSDQSYVLAQVGLSYDIYDAGMRKSKVQAARLENEKMARQIESTQQQILLQVTDRFNAWQNAQNAAETAQKGLVAAESSFKIIQNKYRAGQVLLLEFTNAQNRVTTARLQALLAASDVRRAWWALQQAIGANTL